MGGIFGAFHTMRAETIEIANPQRLGTIFANAGKSQAVSLRGKHRGPAVVAKIVELDFVGREDLELQVWIDGGLTQEKQIRSARNGEKSDSGEQWDKDAALLLGRWRRNDGGRRRSELQRAELQLHIMGGGVALVRILRQAVAHDGIQSLWRQWLYCGDGLRFVFENRGEYAELRFAFEGAASRSHFEQHATEAEDIAAGIGFFALENLGRDVLKCPDDHAFLRER